MPGCVTALLPKSQPVQDGEWGKGWMHPGMRSEAWLWV